MTTLVNTFINYTTLYHTYKLLHCERHIQITSNHNNVNVETNRKNKVNKMTTSNSINLQIILYYIILNDYYIVKDTFRLQVITAM